MEPATPTKTVMTLTLLYKIRVVTVPMMMGMDTIEGLVRMMMTNRMMTVMIPMTVFGMTVALEAEVPLMHVILIRSVPGAAAVVIQVHVIVTIAMMFLNAVIPKVVHQLVV